MDGVGAGELEDAEGDGVVAVHVGFRGVVAGAEFDAGDIAEADDITEVTGFEDDLAELGCGFEASGGGEGVLEIETAWGGRLAEGTGGDLDVLLTYCAEDVSGGEVEGGDFLGIEPKAHRVVEAAEGRGFGDARDAGDFVLDLEGDVVGKVIDLTRTVGAVELGGECEVRGTFVDDDAEASDFLWEARDGGVDAVLDKDLSLVEVGAETEGDGDLHAAVAGGRGGQVEHVLDAIDLLFEGRGDGLGESAGISAGVGGGDDDSGWDDFGVLSDGQAEVGEGAEQGDGDGEDGGKDGPIHEDAGEVHEKLLRGRWSFGVGTGWGFRHGLRGGEFHVDLLGLDGHAIADGHEALDDDAFVGGESFADDAEAVEKGSEFDWTVNGFLLGIDDPDVRAALIVGDGGVADEEGVVLGTAGDADLCKETGSHESVLVGKDASGEDGAGFWIEGIVNEVDLAEVRPVGFADEGHFGGDFLK